MKHCDIYMNTYPIGGGLMCQIAASCGKPIINYKVNPRMDECICQTNDINMSFDTIDDFYLEASHLIDDEQYRIQRGQTFKENIINASQFCEALSYLIEYGNGILPIDYLKMYNYDDTNDLRGAIAREGNSMAYHKFLCKTLKHRLVFFPNVIYRLFSHIVNR